MQRDTEELILNAALKVFAKEGYVGAKTRIIAEEAGFSEMTLFRKFKSKENLFYKLLEEQKRDVLADLFAISRENRIEDPILSLMYLFRKIYYLLEENIGFISLHFNENRRISDFILDEFAVFVSEQIEHKFPQLKIDTILFAQGVLMNLYNVAFRKYRTYVFPENSLEQIIENQISSLKYELSKRST